MIVAVAMAEIECGGNSMYPPYLPLACKWKLKLVNGKIVYRDVRYKPDPNFKRGWFNRRNAEDILPPPTFVYVESR